MLNVLLITLIIIALSCLICKIASFLEDTERLDNAAVSVYDFTFRDDKGNTWVVTAGHISDTPDLLRKDHDLSSSYIFHNVFLANSERIF